MVGKRPEVDTEEFIQSRLEQHVREQYELHGWATTITVANPVDILILLEEEVEDINPINYVIAASIKVINHD
jgi:hypothetical protein